MDNNETTQDQQQNLERFRSFIAAQLSSGADAESIVSRVAAMGVDPGEAAQLVRAVQSEAGTISPAMNSMTTGGEQLVSTALPMAIVGGVLAALVGGCIWGLIVKVTDYEIGFMAWGIGLLCGFGVLVLSGGRHGTPYQVVAVLTSILGIIIGKYATFFFVLKDIVAKEDPGMVANISFFSAKTVSVFCSALPEMVNFFDIIWVVLAVATAWKIPGTANQKTAA